jgi:hypothetical protein
VFADKLLFTVGQAGITTDVFPSTAHSPFPMWRLADTTVVVHLIEWETYVQCRHQVAPAFFQQLSEQFTAEGWRLIHVWEDVWQQQPALVMARLRALAGQSERIPARLTVARRIDRPTAEGFLTNNHLQVTVNSKYKYGLFLPQRYFRVLSPAMRQEVPAETSDLLVAVATFSHPRRISREGVMYQSFEMVRFANQHACTVVGGLDKLLKAFSKERTRDAPGAVDIMTYADRDWSDGRSYERLGFRRTERTEPQPFWVRPGEWVRYYPHRLPPGVPEDQLAAQGYVPVYNAGSIKFVKVIES